MSKNNDPRVIRTKKSIRQALSELLGEKPYNSITVTDIAQKAGINRKTFYSYYSGIDDMILQIEKDMVEELRPMLETIQLASGHFDAYSFFREFNKKVEKNLPVFSILAKADRLTKLTEELNQIIIDVFLREFGYGENAKYVLFAQFAASGIVSMFARWAYSPSITLDEFTDLTAKIALAGFAAINS